MTPPRRVALPVAERDAARARLALPALSADDLPGAEDTDRRLALAKIYGADLVWSADPLAVDAAQREAAQADLAEVCEQFLLVSLPDDWSGIGEKARLSLSAMAAATRPDNLRRDAAGKVTGFNASAEQVLSLQTAIEEICIACVVGVAHVAPDGSGEEVEPFRLHRGPAANGLRPLASIPGTVQAQVRQEVEAHLASFRVEPRRVRRG